jgi:hypothetical protein
MEHQLQELQDINVKKRADYFASFNTMSIVIALARIAILFSFDK